MKLFNRFFVSAAALAMLTLWPQASPADTLTVQNNLDSGAGSLRDVIRTARDDDTIVFSPNLAGQTITLTSGELKIQKDLVIEGPGPSLLAISGNDSSRVFTIHTAADVVIAGLTITHGRATGNSTSENTQGGGAILNLGGNLTLRNAVLLNNLALGGEKVSYFDGGAILNVNSANLTITDSTFVGNMVVGAVGASGGALTNYATAFIARCDFIGNQAQGYDGGSVRGAGIYDLGLGQGGAITNHKGVLTVEDSTFTDNRAIGGSGGKAATGTGEHSFSFIGLAQGGAIANQHDTFLEVRRSTFTGNQAIGGSGIIGGRNGENWLGVAIGGAMFNYNVAEVSDCVFDRNDALAGADNIAGNPQDVVSMALGGAINAAGGVFGGSGALTLTNSLLTGNRAIGGRGSAQGSGGLGLGGAIAIGHFTGAEPTPVSIINSVFSDNSAVGGDGGTDANGGNGFGGAIDVRAREGQSSLTLLDSAITDNRATGGAAGAGGSAGLGIGGGTYFEAGSIVCLDAASLDAIFGNLASTSDDDVFGDFTICP
jgi:hypothetical protein